MMMMLAADLFETFMLLLLLVFFFFFTLFKNAAEESFPGFDQSPKSWLQSLQGGIRIEIHELLVREHVI